MIRTANIEVSLQRLSILRIEHPQANPLKLACTLRAGETLPSAMTITAEIHTSRNVAAETAPLASSSVTVAADATGFEVLFDSPQTNQTVTPDSTRALWLVMYGVGDADQLYTFAAADLLLGWHAISTLTADPPATSILVEKGGVAWAVGRQYVSGTQVTVGTTAYVCTTNNTSTADDQPGVGQAWESFWVVLSGDGGGGATNLGATASPTNVVITSDTGNDATIPAADGTNAGLMLPAEKTKLAGVATGATANATDAQLRDRSTHTGTQAISTIVNLQTTLDGKASTSHTHSIANVTGLQSALDGKAESSSLGDLAFINSVGASRIDTGAVTEAAIAAGAVTFTKIAGAAIGTAAGTLAAGNDSRFHAAVTLATSLTSVFSLSGQDIQVPADLAGDRIVFVDVSAGGLRHLEVGAGLDLTGTTLTSTLDSGGVDNAIIRANGTGGKSTQGSSIVIDDAQISPTPAVCVKVQQSGQTNSAFVLCPMGNGALIAGPSPDNTSTGGAARGTNAVDLQMTRTSSAHVASGASSFVGVGVANAATAANSATIGGLANQATAAQAVAHGSRAISNRLNMMAHGNSSVAGECQAGRVIMRRTTTDATPVQLSMDGANPTGAGITTSTHFILLNNQALSVGIRIIARSATGAGHARFLREVVIHRDANAASTTVDNVEVVGTDFKSAGASTWDVAITADTSNGGMLITVTGAATTIVWGAAVEFMEIIRA